MFSKRIRTFSVLGIGRGASLKEAQDVRESGAARQSRFKIGGPCFGSEGLGSEINRDRLVNGHNGRADTTIAYRPMTMSVPQLDVGLYRR